MEPQSLILGPICAIAMGGAMLLALRIFYRGRKPVADLIHGIIWLIGMILCVIGWLSFLLLVFNVLGLFLFFVSVVVMVLVWRQGFLHRQRVHLALLTLAVEKQISLPECVEEYAHEEGGSFGARLLRFAEQLRSGVPLQVAISRNTSVLPRLSALAARVGVVSQQLSLALRQELASEGQFAPLRRSVTARVLYLSVVFAYLPLILSFVMIKIVPAFVRIFNDFEVDLPQMTVLLIGLSNMVVEFWAFFVPFKMLGLFFLFCSVGWFVGFRPPLPPPLSWLARRFDRSVVMRALAFPAERGQSLLPMIDLLSRNYPNRKTSRRLKRAESEIRGGQPWIPTLYEHRLIGRADESVLLAAERAGNVSWALREMAESNERRLIYWLEALVEVISTVILVGLAGVIGFVVVALFIPLVKLIEALT